MMTPLAQYDFHNPIKGGVLISAGGFEERATTFLRHLRSDSELQMSILLRYRSQQRDNDANFKFAKRRLTSLLGRIPDVVDVHGARPHEAYDAINATVRKLAPKLNHRSAIVDISGMTQFLAVCTVHSCFLAGLSVRLVYTEAQSYFPVARESRAVLRAWKSQDFKRAALYLQSEALRSIHILPEFAGTFGRLGQSCLILFAGYEPNRVEGLVQFYAPDRLIVCYGRSPHERLRWRTNLSKELHKNLFADQHLREIEVSTLNLEEIMALLESEFNLLHEHYDMAIAPQCAKMQAIASYLFWRSHPEIQLVFTSPVRFNPKHYSSRAGHTFWCDLTQSQTSATLKVHQGI
jgi:hypothetical protein